LATFDRYETHIKARDRTYHVQGYVRTTCPRCGTEHGMSDTMRRARAMEGVDKTSES
jgi:hypothetical protein